MITKSTKWLIALFLLTPLSALSGQVETRPASAATITPTSTSSAEAKSEQASTEIAVLKALLDEERTHNAAVLQTVYWSLGVIVTLAVGLIGFGWLVNFRVYERDKDAMMKALQADLRAGLTESRQLTAEAATTLRQQALDQAEELRNETKAMAVSAAQGLVKNLDKRVQSLVNDLSELTLELHLLNADHLFDKQLYGNGFTASINAISLAKNLGRTKVIAHILDSLEGRIAKMTGMFGSDITKISSFLEDLEGVPSVQKERIIEALRHIRKI